MIKETLSARTWLFGDQINTDDMFPGYAMGMKIRDAAKHTFAVSRPGWSQLVSPGDAVVAGRGFGIGSSRPVPLLFKELGVAFVVAEQFNSLFFRNCINYGLLPVVCPGITEAITEGELITLDTIQWQITTESGNVLQAKPLPPMLRDTVARGGLLNRLEQEGYLTSPSIST